MIGQFPRDLPKQAGAWIAWVAPGRDGLASRSTLNANPWLQRRLSLSPDRPVAGQAGRDLSKDY